MTGGLALDTGLLAALKECLTEQGLEVKAKSHADSIYAGAMGAAICAAFRYDKLAGLGLLPTCPPYDFGRRERSSGFAQAGGVYGRPYDKAPSTATVDDPRGLWNAS